MLTEHFDVSLVADKTDIIQCVCRLTRWVMLYPAAADGIYDCLENVGGWLGRKPISDECLGKHQGCLLRVPFHSNISLSPPATHRENTALVLSITTALLYDLNIPPMASGTRGTKAPSSLNQRFMKYLHKAKTNGWQNPPTEVITLPIEAAPPYFLIPVYTIHNGYLTRLENDVLSFAAGTETVERNGSPLSQSLMARVPSSAPGATHKPLVSPPHSGELRKNKRSY